MPICFPWFGPHPSDPAAPAHGLVRDRLWNPVQTAASPDGQVDTEMVYSLDQLHALYRVTFGPRLELALTVRNHTESDQTFEAALHTYFRVADVRNVHITGLENTRYTDKLRGNETYTQSADPVTFTGETDRIYHDTQAACVLHDPGLNRRITVEKEGSRSTVVWNPWIDKAQRMSDFGDDEWPTMCCIESAAIGENAIELGPGQSHTLRVVISVERP